MRRGRIDSALVAVARERWNRRRFAAVGLGLLSFYVTYLAYRNLKGFLPFITDQDYDPKLLVARPDVLLRARPRAVPARPARDGHLRPGPVDGLPLLPRVRADLARRRADRVRQPDPGPLVRDRARHQLDARHRLVPDAAVARAGLRGAGPLLDAAGHRDLRAPAGADLRAPRGTRGGGAQSIAAFASLHVSVVLHGGADRDPAEGQPRAALLAVGVPRADDDRHAVLRLALRRRRPRRARASA